MSHSRLEVKATVGVNLVVRMLSAALQFTQLFWFWLKVSRSFVSYPCMLKQPALFSLLALCPSKWILPCKICHPAHATPTSSCLHSCLKFDLYYLCVLPLCVKAAPNAWDDSQVAFSYKAGRASHMIGFQLAEKSSYMSASCCFKTISFTRLCHMIQLSG